jgi:Spy/CpxP family protein refolding chaperone
MHPASAPRAVFSPLTGLRFARRTFSAVAFATVLGTASAVFAQAPDDANRRRRPDDAGGDRGGRGNFDPAQMQERMLSTLRERLEIKDDEEWKLISERVAKLQEIRRNSPGAGGGIGALMLGGRGGPGGPPGGGERGPRGPGGPGGRGPGGSSPEVSALTSALRDKLPDAEIKNRLDRVREVRKSNEIQLAKAQEDLRAVLTVRQEAVAVLFGLLP